MRRQKIKKNIIILVLIVACIGVGAMIIDSLKSSKEALDIVGEAESQKEDQITDKETHIEEKNVEEPETEPKEELIKNAKKDVKGDDTTESQEIKEAMQHQITESTDEQSINQQEPSEIKKEDTKQEQANIQPEEPKKEPVKEKPKTDSKPESSNNDNLVPDSENPFKQLPTPELESGLNGETNLEDITDHVPGTGDKF
ncbi:MAG: hypothetical protein MJA82_09520 [Clostridia bacterium]|nr:hypothetical protein [Clostridia bacterium]